MDVTRVFAERGDLAHLALFRGASRASAQLRVALRDLAAPSPRVAGFVSEIARLTQRMKPGDGD